MTTNIRVSSQVDPRLYNVDRDVAWNFSHVVDSVIDRLDRGTWPELYGDDPSEEQQLAVSTAINAVVLTVAKLKEDPTVSMPDAAAMAGLNENDEATKIVMAMIGSHMFGMFWQGAKEVSSADNCPIEHMADRVRKAEEIAAIVERVSTKKPTKITQAADLLRGVTKRFRGW